MIRHTIYHPEKGFALTSTSMIGHTIYHPRKGSTLISNGMVGHTNYHPKKGSALTFVDMIGHTIYHPGKGSALISHHGRTHLPPCQKGSTLTSDPFKKAMHLHLTMGGPTYHHVRRAPHLHLT